MLLNHEYFVLLVSIITNLGLYIPNYNTSMKKLCHIHTYIFPVIFQDFVNVENHAYWQKLFRYEVRLQETPGTISRSG
jgi:hypothetical protein